MDPRVGSHLSRERPCCAPPRRRQRKSWQSPCAGRTPPPRRTTGRAPRGAYAQCHWVRGAVGGAVVAPTRFCTAKHKMTAVPDDDELDAMGCSGSAALRSTMANVKVKKAKATPETCGEQKGKTKVNAKRKGAKGDKGGNNRPTTTPRSRSSQGGPSSGGLPKAPKRAAGGSKQTGAAAGVSRKRPSQIAGQGLKGELRDEAAQRNSQRINRDSQVSLGNAEMSLY